MAQKGPNQENSQKNIWLYPGCREKKGRTCCPTPKQTLFLYRKGIIVSFPLLFLSMKGSFQKEHLIRRSRWAWEAQPSCKPLYPVQRERVRRCT